MIMTPQTVPRSAYFFKPENFRKTVGRRVRMMPANVVGWLFETFDYKGEVISSSFQPDEVAE